MGSSIATWTLGTVAAIARRVAPSESNSHPLEAVFVASGAKPRCGDSVIARVRRNVPVARRCIARPPRRARRARRSPSRSSCRRAGTSRPRWPVARSWGSVRFDGIRPVRLDASPPCLGLKTPTWEADTLSGVISVVVPLLNEEHSLEALYREISDALESQGQPFEVIFVDDGSTDGSLAVLSRLHAETTNVVVVHLRRNFGKAAALQAGFLEARGDIVVTIDADLQDDPAEIPQLLAKLDEGFDLVSGWKTRRNDPFDATPLLAAVQLVDRGRFRRPSPRRELRPEGVSRGGAAGDAPLRRASSLHPRPGVLPRLPHCRDPGQPPRAPARPFSVRARALPAWVLRPAQRHLHGPLPPAPASSLRRPRPPHGRDRVHHPALPHRHLVLGRRASATARS